MRKWTYDLYDDGETFAVYDDGNMIAHCLSPEDARVIVTNHDDVEQLRARVAELENRDREECCTDYKAKLRARIAELEAAQQWHPASEPPENGRDVMVLIDYVYFAIGTYDVFSWHICGIGMADNVTHWRELPALSEVVK